MITQSHVRETSSRQPPASSATKLSARARVPDGERGAARATLRDGKRGGVDGEDLPRVGDRHNRAGDRRADDERAARSRPVHGVGLLQPLGLTVAGTTPVAAGWKNASAAPGRRRPGPPGARASAVPVRKRIANVAWTAKPIGVRRQHHELPRQPIGPHASDQDKGHQRQGVCGEHETEPVAVPSRLDTANTSATGSNPSPSVEVAWPSQSSRKRGSRRAPNVSEGPRADSASRPETPAEAAYMGASADAIGVVEPFLTTSVPAIMSCRACFFAVNAAMMKPM